MGKNKKVKKGLSDSVTEKKSKNKFSGGPKPLNPFELHINREKFDILGRKTSHSLGIPGASRAKALKRRKETLGQEFILKDKVNKFKDRRISGKSDDGMARFANEKIAQFTSKKTSRFNLNDDEILTHKGQTLVEIEKFHNDASDDDEDDAELNENMTEAAFGGGDDGMDRKSAIDDMIVEAKRRKAEAAKEKEEVTQLTDNLDSQYKNILGIMGQLSRSDNEPKPKPDDYDRAMREMIFEPKGSVTDKLETPEEIAEKERSRLERLESARLARMKGEEESSESKKRTHRSADALDDDFYLGGDEDIEDEPNILAYGLDGQRTDQQHSDNTKEIEEDDESEEGEEEDEEESGEDDDNLSDLKGSESEDDEDEKEETPTEKISNVIYKANQSSNNLITDLPFTFEMPLKYEDFTNLLENQSVNRQAIIVERIIKCNHPKLNGANKDQMVKLFTFILQYINDLFTDPVEELLSSSFEVLSALTPHMFDLVQMDSEKMSLALINVLKEKSSDFKKNSRTYPELDTVIFFKIVSNLCSTSDFRHRVVTPAFVFMSNILTRVQPKTRSDIATGLFLVTLILEYTLESKRFLPAAINYLLGMVHMAIPKRPVEVIKIIPPFASSGLESKLLAVVDFPDAHSLQEEQLKGEDLIATSLTVDFKLRALNTALKLIADFVENLKEHVGFNFLAAPLLEMLERLNIEVYPDFVQQHYKSTVAVLREVTTKPLTKLVPPPQRPRMIKQLEPVIEKVLDDKRRPKLTKAKEERVKLMHKIKRATKGAMREIRRDTQFMQNIKHKQQMASDAERKAKVKRIYAEASVQQAEFNDMERAKKKKK